MFKYVLDLRRQLLGELVTYILCYEVMVDEGEARIVKKKPL